MPLNNRGHTGLVRSDIARQLSRTPRSRFSSITVRVSILCSGFVTYRAFVIVSPPHVVGYANGIAQSIVSFSRFLGPIAGGTVSCSTPFRRSRTYDPPVMVRQCRRQPKWIPTWVPRLRGHLYSSCISEFLDQVGMKGVPVPSIIVSCIAWRSISSGNPRRLAKITARESPGPWRCPFVYLFPPSHVVETEYGNG